MTSFFVPENEPVVGLGARKFPTEQPEPSFQTASNNPPLTPGRNLVSSAQPSSARDQPSWAEIFTPQRSARVQESAVHVQATRPQPSLEPLRTPAIQQGPQEDICTPQCLILGTQVAGIAQGHARSRFANTSSPSVRKPLVEFKQQHSALTIDLPPNHETLATPARQLQTRSQVPKSDLPPSSPESSHVHGSIFQLPVRTFTTPARQDSVVSQSHSINDPLLTPLKRNLPVTKDPCSARQQQPPMANISVSRQGGDAIQDLGPRLRCSTVQITSFQPSVDTLQGSCSTEEFLTPQQNGLRKEHLKLTTVEV